MQHFEEKTYPITNPGFEKCFVKCTYLNGKPYIVYVLNDIDIGVRYYDYSAYKMDGWVDRQLKREGQTKQYKKQVFDELWRIINNNKGGKVTLNNEVIDRLEEDEVLNLIQYDWSIDENYLL